MYMLQYTLGTFFVFKVFNSNGLIACNVHDAVPCCNKVSPAYGVVFYSIYDSALKRMWFDLVLYISIMSSIMIKRNRCSLPSTSVKLPLGQIQCRYIFVHGWLFAL